MLNLKKTWLKRWVTARAVPHQRSGSQRGVWFTYADIAAIARMLPELMTGTQANSRAETPDRASLVSSEVHAEMSASVTDEALAGFASLVSLRA